MWREQALPAYHLSSPGEASELCIPSPLSSATVTDEQGATGAQSPLSGGPLGQGGHVG